MKRLQRVADMQDATELVNYTLDDNRVIKVLGDYDVNKILVLDGQQQIYSIKNITNRNLNEIEKKILKKFDGHVVSKAVVTPQYTNKAKNSISIVEDSPAWTEYLDSNDQENPQEVKIHVIYFESGQQAIDQFLANNSEFVVSAQPKYLLTADLIRRRKIAASATISSSRLFRKVVEAASWIDVVKNNVDFKHGGVKNLATYYPADNASNTAFVGKDSDYALYYAILSNGSMSSFPTFREAENYLLGNNPEPIGDREVTQDGYDDGNVSNSDVWSAYQFQEQQQNFQDNLQDEDYRNEHGISDDYQHNEQNFAEYWQQNPAQTDPNTEEKEEQIPIALDLTVKVTSEEKDNIEKQLDALKDQGVVDEWKFAS